VTTAANLDLVRSSYHAMARETRELDHERVLVVVAHRDHDRALADLGLEA
jgi:hypothetical protein